MSLKIIADIIITGDGSFYENYCLVTEGNTIVYVGPKDHAPEANDTIETEVAMPGMWDTHVHYSGIYTASVEQTIYTKATLAALRSTRDVRETLRSGFTSVREVGGHGIALNQAIAEGVIMGPRIYSSGSLLSSTGGHGDIHNIPLDFVSTLEGQGFSVLCDGVPECLRAVRKQLRDGAEVIKFCASGGVMSKIDHPVHQQFSQEEQNAIVSEANRAEVAVAAHCHGAPGIAAALIAGVTTIDHGTFLTEELADRMIEQGAILVPTRYVIERLIASAVKMGVPEYAVKKINALADQHKNAIQMAIKKGVKIALGTDIFTTGAESIFVHGDNAKELEYLVEMGMSPMDAIVAATGNGPLTLGGRAPKSGLIKVGYEADIITLRENPLEDISVLVKKENITNVIKQGEIVF